MEFDEGRLDNPSLLQAADLRLRALAESGARVRRQVHLAEESFSTLARWSDLRPRAIVVAGPDAGLATALLHPSAPMPVAAIVDAPLPGWVGALDLTVIVTLDGDDVALAALAAEATRRGSPLIVLAPARTLLAEHGSGPDSVWVALESSDDFAVLAALVVVLRKLKLAGVVDTERLAQTLDDVAVENSPHRDFTLNPAKLTALAIAESAPLVWGGDQVLDYAAHRFGAQLRQLGLPATAERADELTAVLETTREVSIFDDPDDGGPRPTLVVVEPTPAPEVRPGDAVGGKRVADQTLLRRTADRVGVRTEVVPAPGGHPLAQYAAARLNSLYIVEYLRIGLID